MGSFRSAPEKTKHTLTGKSGWFSYAVSHMCGWRLYMEDAHISAPLKDSNHWLFAVFDGHGGPQVATFVQRHFVKELQSHASYVGAGRQKDYSLALKQTFMRMDMLLMTNQGKKQIAAIQKQMREKDNAPKIQQQSHAGCTANVLLITPDTVYCANAGDSRAVACLSGRAQALSFDHKPQDPVQLQRIKKAGGSVMYGRVDGGLNLSRAIGDLQYKKNTQLKAQEQKISAKPDVKKMQLKGIDFIIMGCDGIWQVKSNQQMVEWIKKRIESKQTQTALLEELLDELVAKDTNTQFGMDNMSSILIQINKKT